MIIKLFFKFIRYKIKRLTTKFMKGKKIGLLSLIIASYPLSLMAQGVDCVLPDKVVNSPYHANAKFEVWLPSSEEPVVYNVELYSTPSPADTLAPCNYLIEWTVQTESGESSGFSAYYDGHHYRYRGDRLQEYHADWDMIPFNPSLSGSRGMGVQRTAQFVDLLPAFLAEKLHGMAVDSTFTYKITPSANVGGKNCTVISGEQGSAGFSGQEFTYVFDNTNGMPMSIDLNSNPGSISEQLVSVKYTMLPDEAVEITEEMLIDRYPEVFEKFRENNFRIENLRGGIMPEFSSPTITGNRYTHHKGEPFRVPTVIALLDPGIGDAVGLTSNVREAVASLPFDADIIWAFVTNKVEDIEEIIGEEGRIGESTLIGARSMARDTGAASLPVLIFVTRAGKVADVLVGDNKNLSSIVIQKMAVMPQD